MRRAPAHASLARRLLVVASTVAVVACRSESVPRSPREELGLDRVWSDLGGAPKALWGDVHAVFGDRTNLYTLGGLGALSLAAESFEDEERDIVERLEVFGETTSSTFQYLGDGALLLTGSLGLTLFGALADRGAEYEAGKVMTEALVLTGLTPIALKGLIAAQRPNGDSGDFPSGHSSMAMAAAAALDATYGPKVGVPAYIAAAMVGLQRLDSDHHDLAAVTFGWTLGFLTARSIAHRRDGVASELQLRPMFDAEREAVGIGLHWSF